MALVNRSILLDITPGAIPQIVNVSEYDQNRAYTVNLVDKGGVYSIPSGTTAKVEGTIGGNPFSVNCTVNGDAITFELDESMTAAAGDAWCKIKLVKDSKPIQTCAFILRCDRAGAEADAVISAPGFREQIDDAVEAYIEKVGVQKDDLICITYDGEQIETLFDRNLDNLPRNTYLWTSKSFWDGLPDDVDDYFWVVTLSAFAADRTPPTVVGTQLLINDGGRILHRRVAGSGWSDFSDFYASALEKEIGALKPFNCYDLLSDYNPAKVEKGITFTKAADGGVHVSGTATADSFYNFYLNTSAIPGNIEAGKTYRAKYDGSASVKFQLWFYKNGSYLSGYSITGDRDDLTVPADATGIVLRLAVNNGTTVNETVHPFLFAAMSNAELTEKVTDLDGGRIENPNAHLRSFGNSILTGSVWKNGSFDHLVEYANAPYGNIAAALRVPQTNVNHTLISSTGLLYDAGSGNFLTNIKNTDLSGYDYLLTHFWTEDMGTSYPLGSTSSTAGDGTLAGAVLELLDYIETSNGLCTLVLVSVPPVRGTADVFTHAYGNGSTIADLDTLMHELADAHHFVYLDWQSMGLSYRYQDYTDGTNVHANNEGTYRVMGEYLSRMI